MVKKKKSRGISISADSVQVSGDIVGRDKKINLLGSQLRPRQPNSSPKRDSGQQDPEEVITILFLAANPIDKEPLRLDEEIREIKKVLLQGKFRDRFRLEQEWAVRISDLQGYLLQHQPHIVHFSGHGSNESQLILEDATGSGSTVPLQAISTLFALFKARLRCIVLNACYSESQARTIAENIDCVVGMSESVEDSVGIRFSAAFYQALAHGHSVKMAFELGRNQVNLDPGSAHQANIPQLIARKGCDPAEVILA